MIATKRELDAMVNARVSAMMVALKAGWERYQRTRKLPADWQELHGLEGYERERVRQVLVARCLWNAGAPLFTVDGRRIR